jgi:hypothetical protein
MSRLVRTAGGCCVVVLAALCVAACGGGERSTARTAGARQPLMSSDVSTSTNSPGSPVIARVGRYTIMRSQIAQWMPTVLAEDFFVASSHRLPQPLVSDPPDYRRCVEQLHTMTPIRGRGRRQPQPSRGRLESLCHQLYTAARLQTVLYLVGSYWALSFDSSHGIDVSSAEVKQAVARKFSNAARLQKVLSDHRRTLSEQLFETELELFQEKLLRRAHLSSQAINLLAEESSQPQFAVDCAAGYVVEHCKGFSGTTRYPGGRSPSIIVQEIARWRPSTSHGFTGQPLCTSGRTTGCI